ncbi:MAG: DUF1206 domain-containing protein [Actinomycetota bacterium]|nr:DUF1206 domain-containing protein [Actinomycetota bacterium]
MAPLAINVASGHSRRGAQANANGALVQVARTSTGLILLGAVALGFAAFGVIRLAGAYGDRKHGRLRRLSTAGQAVLYLLMAAGTVPPCSAATRPAPSSSSVLPPLTSWGSPPAGCWSRSSGWWCWPSAAGNCAWESAATPRTA